MYLFFGQGPPLPELLPWDPHQIAMKRIVSSWAVKAALPLEKLAQIKVQGLARKEPTHPFKSFRAKSLQAALGQMLWGFDIDHDTEPPGGGQDQPLSLPEHRDWEKERKGGKKSHLQRES